MHINSTYKEGNHQACCNSGYKSHCAVVQIGHGVPGISQGWPGEDKGDMLASVMLLDMNATCQGNNYKGTQRKGLVLHSTWVREDWSPVRVELEWHPWLKHWLAGMLLCWGPEAWCCCCGLGKETPQRQPRTRGQCPPSTLQQHPTTTHIPQGYI